MNLSNLLNNIKVAQSKNINRAYSPYSKLALKILDLLKEEDYILDYQIQNYKIKINLKNKIRKIYTIKPRLGLNSDKLFKLYKNIYIGSGHLIITNSSHGLCKYDPNLKMAGVPLLYVSI